MKFVAQRFGFEEARAMGVCPACGRLIADLSVAFRFHPVMLASVDFCSQSHAEDARRDHDGDGSIERIEAKTFHPERRAEIAASANAIGRMSRRGGCPTLTADSIRQSLCAWLQWHDANGSHTDELAAADRLDPYTTDEAWCAVAEVVADAERDWLAGKECENCGRTRGDDGVCPGCEYPLPRTVR